MSWSRNFFVWEEALVGQLLELVGVVVLREEDEKSDSAKSYCFILKSAYWHNFDLKKSRVSSSAS